MRKLFSQIVAAILGLWIATQFIGGVVVRVYPDSNFFGFSLTAQWQIFLVLGGVLGFLNYFVKPLLKAISLPLQIVTIGLFSILINMGLIFVLSLMFDELNVPFFLPLLYTTLLILGLNIIIEKFLVKYEE